MATIESLIKRLQKLKRQEAFLSLLEAVRTRPLTQPEKIRFLQKIMQLILDEKITPQEANKLTKAVMKGR